MSKILVTGGTGLIGSHLIEVLLEEGTRSQDIQALVRRHSDTSFLTAKGVQLCYGDVLDGDSLKAAIRDVRIVFHCAGFVGIRRRIDSYSNRVPNRPSPPQGNQPRTGRGGEMLNLSPRDAWRMNWGINFGGTEQVLEAARCAGVEKFIYVSTAAIHGLPGPYAASKLAAEEKAREYYQTYGLKTVVIRPTLTIGERDAVITRLLMNVARRKVVPLVNGGGVCVPFVHAKDVARALILASESDQAVGNSYDVEGFSVSMKGAIEFFIESLGSKAKVWNVPYRVAYLGALLAEVFFAIAQRSLDPLVSGNLVRSARFMATGVTLDTAKIRRELGFEPQYGMEESFQQAIRWQLEQGY